MALVTFRWRFNLKSEGEQPNYNKLYPFVIISNNSKPNRPIGARWAVQLILAININLVYQAWKKAESISKNNILTYFRLTQMFTLINKSTCSSFFFFPQGLPVANAPDVPQPCDLLH
jgi:hypothetical protein